VRHRGGEIDAGTCHELQAELGAPHPLAAECGSNGFKMCPGWIDGRRVAQPELDVDGRGNSHELAEFLHAHEATDIVGTFDVDVEGNVDRRLDRGNLGEVEVSLDVQSVGPELDEYLCSRRIGDR